MSFAAVFLLLPLMLFGAASPNQIVNVTLNEINSIGVTPAGNITLTLSAPATAGDLPQSYTDATKYLIYTTLNAQNWTRSLTAGLSVNAPNGTSLALTGAIVAGGYGTSQGQKTLSTTAQTLVTAVGSGATGTGNNGINLQFILSATNTSVMTVANTNITVTLTMTDDS